MHILLTCYLKNAKVFKIYANINFPDKKTTSVTGYTESTTKSKSVLQYIGKTKEEAIEYFNNNIKDSIVGDFVWNKLAPKKGGFSGYGDYFYKD